MNVIVTGASGLLGWDIADAFEERGHMVTRFMGRKDVDLLDTSSTCQAIHEAAPDLVVHAAGYRDLDDLELHQRDGFRTNVLGTWNVVQGCRKTSSKLIYISSDTVFDGTRSAGGYNEFDDPCPVNAYGRTKVAAEKMIHSLWDKSFIVRTALLFGYKGHRENNFLFHILDQLRAGNRISASTDQVCCPSYTADLARALVDLGESDWFGTYHISNVGSASRYEVSCAVAELAGLDPTLIEPAESDSTKIAPRAKRTVFDSLAWPAAFGYELPDWRDALRRCMESCGEAEGGLR